MKLTTNKLWSAFGAVALVLALVISISGCDTKFKWDLPLAVSQHDISLSSSAGSTHVYVYCTGDWTIKLTKDVEWASLDRTSGYGTTDFVFSYGANYGISRKVGVEVASGSLRDTIFFSQEGNISVPTVSFSNTSMTLLMAPAAVTAGFSTNLQYMLDDFKVEITYYDASGNAMDPVVVKTRADGDDEEDDSADEGGEEEVDTPTVYVDPWISDLTISTSAVKFRVSENIMGFNRMADIRVSIEDASGVSYNANLRVTQTTELPKLEFERSSEVYSSMAQSCTVPTIENNIWMYSSEYTLEVEYADFTSEEDAWITNPALSSSALTFSLAANGKKSSREATITISYTDELGNSAVASFTAVQEEYIQTVSFPELRAMSPGLITEDIGVLEGFIVSDYESPNVRSSIPQATSFTFDTNVNYRTAYVESSDGTYGVMLEFDDSTENTLERFSRVQIILEGLTLSKNASPEYYVLSGLTADSIRSSADPDESAVPVKYKTINELTDNDIFTMVTLQGLEIMQKDGSYTNANEGYSRHDDLNPVNASSATEYSYDVVPLLLYDMEGKWINMLTNMAAPWRRPVEYQRDDLLFYDILPQGSGTLRGVIVADEVVAYRYGSSNCGRYQIRMLEEEDIQFNDPAFTETIAEWTWNDADSSTRLTPDEGEGTIEIDSSGLYLERYNDWNNNCNSNNSSGSSRRGVAARCSMYMTNMFYNPNTGNVCGINVTFSTANISGSMLFFGWTWNAGSRSSNIMSPNHWKLLYSIDGGETFTEVTPGEVIDKRALVWWIEEKGATFDTVPGLVEVCRTLPSECFGKDEVIVRLEPYTDGVTDIVPSNTSASNWADIVGHDKGTVPASDSTQSLVFGTITVRYN